MAEEYFSQFECDKENKNPDDLFNDDISLTVFKSDPKEMTRIIVDILMRKDTMVLDSFTPRKANDLEYYCEVPQSTRLLYGIALTPEQVENVDNITFTVDNNFCQIHKEIKVSPHGLKYIPTTDIPFPLKETQLSRTKMTIKLHNPVVSSEFYIYGKILKDLWKLSKMSTIGPYKVKGYRLIPEESDWELIN